MTAGDALKQYKTHLAEIGETTSLASKAGSAFKSILGNVASFAINAGAIWVVSKALEVENRYNLPKDEKYKEVVKEIMKNLNFLNPSDKAKLTTNILDVSSVEFLMSSIDNIMDIAKTIGSDLGITDTDKYCYIMTYSFPCQDLSVAGKQKGMQKGSGTRSGLLWEVERLLNEVENLPQVLLMENVPQVHSKANMPDFQKWIDFLESKGYSNYWQDLNAKNYGVAQNRNRCFMVSILGDYTYNFPNPIPLEKTMKDYLEDEVDEKYYINNENAQNSKTD